MCARSRIHGADARGQAGRVFYATVWSRSDALLCSAASQSLYTDRIHQNYDDHECERKLKKSLLKYLKKFKFSRNVKNMLRVRVILTFNKQNVIKRKSKNNDRLFIPNA